MINYNIYSTKNQVFKKNLITFIIVYKNNLFIDIICPLLLIFLLYYIFFENYLEIPNKIITTVPSGTMVVILFSIFVFKIGL